MFILNLIKKILSFYFILFPHSYEEKLKRAKKKKRREEEKERFLGFSQSNCGTLHLNILFPQLYL